MQQNDSAQLITEKYHQKIVYEDTDMLVVEGRFPKELTGTGLGQYKLGWENEEFIGFAAKNYHHIGNEDDVNSTTKNFTTFKADADRLRKLIGLTEDTLTEVKNTKIGTRTRKQSPLRSFLVGEISPPSITTVTTINKHEGLDGYCDFDIQRNHTSIHESKAWTMEYIERYIEATEEQKRIKKEQMERNIENLQKVGVVT
jgi:hypothetical protein